MIDISDHLEPEEVGWFSHSPSDFYGLYVHGNRAYVSACTRGLDIFDVSNPEDLTLLHTIDLGWNAREVYVSGSYVYVTNVRGGLVIVNIHSGEVVSRTMSMDYYVNAAAFRDAEYAYVTTWDMDEVEELWVIDISNPDYPVPLGSVELPSRSHKVFLSGNYVYAGTNRDGLQVVDVSNPQAPQMVGSFPTYSSNVLGIFVKDMYAFVTDIGGAIHQIDISDPSTLFEVGRIEGWGSPRGVWVKGDHAYIVDLKKLRVVEIKGD